jgi:hypothetical protein
MTADSDPGAIRRRWAAAAQERLATVMDAVALLRATFEGLSEKGSGSGDDPSEQVLASCAELATWLDGSRAPKGLGKAGGELGAVAGVYRNAAFAFRSLDDVDDARPARVAACATMLEQGNHHVETFLAMLAKKVRTDPPECKPG